MSAGADDAMTADALSTGLFVAPPLLAERVARNMPQIAVYPTAAGGEMRRLNA